MQQQPLALSTEINNIRNHVAIVTGLKRTIKDSLTSPSISQLITSGANRIELEQVLAVIISKYANMLTVGGNLNPNHPLEYAKNILNDWPTMSLDDFNILLANGVKHKYNEPGKLFRFDISVIYDWIAKYQNDWCDEYEKFLSKQKNAPLLMDAKVSTEAEKLMDSFLDKLSDFKKIPAMTEDEIWEAGKKDRVKKGITLAREKFVIDGLEVHADSEKEAEKMVKAFKSKKK